MIHYTELEEQLRSHGFKAAIYDDASVVGNHPRIYLNGYGEKTKVYLFADPVRRQNNFQNPISGYGLHVNIDFVLEAREKLNARQQLKWRVMTDLYYAGFALRPVPNYKIISL